MRHGPLYSASLGGYYWYDDATDMIIRHDGSSFRRPSTIASASLLVSPPAGTCAQQSIVSPLAGTSAQQSVATEYSSQHLEGPWHSPAIGGEYKYDRQVDQFVLPDGRRLPRPSNVPRPTSSSQAIQQQAGNGTQGSTWAPGAPPPISYSVYTAEYLGSPNHIGIFVETGQGGAGAGHFFHVVGSVVKGGGGMKYEDKQAQNPVNSGTYVPGTKKYIGTVKMSDLGRFRHICQSIPVPGPQLNLNGSRMDKSKPVRRCI